MTTFVLIHGSYQGGWIWQPVANRLRATGHAVYAPSLDGCAERKHSLRPGITTETHAAEIGDLLFAVVNLARKCKIDAESALQSATNKFVARFNQLEDELKTRGSKLGEVELEEMDAIWGKIKNGGSGPAP